MSLDPWRPPNTAGGAQEVVGACRDASEGEKQRQQQQLCLAAHLQSAAQQDYTGHFGKGEWLKAVAPAAAASTIASTLSPDPSPTSSQVAELAATARALRFESPRSYGANEVDPQGDDQRRRVADLEAQQEVANNASRELQGQVRVLQAELGKCRHEATNANDEMVRVFEMCEHWRKRFQDCEHDLREVRNAAEVGEQRQHKVNIRAQEITQALERLPQAEHAVENANIKLKEAKQGWDQEAAERSRLQSDVTELRWQLWRAEKDQGEQANARSRLAAKVGDLERHLGDAEAEQLRDAEQQAKLLRRSQELEKQLAEALTTARDQERAERAALQGRLQMALRQAERAAEERDEQQRRAKEQERLRAEAYSLRDEYAEEIGALKAQVLNLQGRLGCLSAGQAASQAVGEAARLREAAASDRSPSRARSPMPAAASAASSPARVRSASPSAASPSAASRARSTSPAGAAGEAPVDGLPADYVEVLRQIERKGWKAVDWERGFTLLHWAAKHDRAQLCEWLLWQGADAFAPDASGQRPVDYARSNKSDEAMAALVRRAFPHSDRQANASILQTV